MAIKLSHGNKKLVSNENVRFLIWSIPPIATCPFSTALCRRFCYAMKAYKAYPNARRAWDGNYAESLKSSFVEDMINSIKRELARPSYKRAKQVVIRIHESGDFYSQAYANKWRVIASAFMDDPRVRFMAYTKSVEYFADGRTPANMTVRFSLWADTEPEQVAIAKAMNLPIYTAVESFTSEPARERCECVDCGHCAKCWSSKFAMLKCEIH